MTVGFHWGRLGWQQKGWVSDMCLAVPGEIIRIIDNNRVLIAFGGVEMEVRSDLVEGVEVGMYVIVHAGYIINVMDEREGLETLELLGNINDV